MKWSDPRWNFRKWLKFLIATATITLVDWLLLLFTEEQTERLGERIAAIHKTLTESIASIKENWSNLKAAFKKGFGKRE